MEIEREKAWLPSESQVVNASFQSSQVKQYNIITDVLGGYSADVSHAVKELVGEKSATILKRMRRYVISHTLNIANSFKILA